MSRIRLLAVAAALAAPALAAAAEPTFKKHDVNPKSIFECGGAWDVDNDGKVDIVSGDTWYKAPDWTPYPVRKVSKTGTYMNDFSNIPLDVNGDGNVDFVTTAYFTKNVGWVENPGKAGKAEWTYHEVDTPGNIEATVRVDLDGDGIGDILPNSTNVVVWYAIEKSSDGKGYRFARLRLLVREGLGRSRRRHGRCHRRRPARTSSLPTAGSSRPPIPRTMRGPGTPTGSSPPPVSRSSDATSTATASRTSPFTAWATASASSGGRGRSADGKVTLGNEELIDKEVSSVHTLLWADLDSDGKADELITGKRVYAHEREPGDLDSPIVAYYTFDPSG